MSADKNEKSLLEQKKMIKKVKEGNDQLEKITNDPQKLIKLRQVIAKNSDK